MTQSQHTKNQPQNNNLHAEVFDRTLFLIVLGLSVVLLVANFLWIFFYTPFEDWDGLVGRIVYELDFNHDTTASAWFSSMLILLSSLAAYRLTRLLSYHSFPSVASRSMLISLGLFFLSMDDITEIHESFEEDFIEPKILTPLNEVLTNIDDYTGVTFASIVALVLFILVLGPFWKHITRRSKILLVVSLLFIVGAALAELIYELMGCYTTFCFRVEVLFEEGFEIAAILVFYKLLTDEVLRMSEFSQSS